MPQFDIASFFPQITFFAGIFLMFYVFLARSILPKISKNLKLNSRIANLFIDAYSPRSCLPLDALCRIYKPSRFLRLAVYKETLCLVYTRKMVQLITLSLIASLH